MICYGCCDFGIFRPICNGCLGFSCCQSIIGMVDIDNALKCVPVIYLCGRYLLITMLNLYN